ncbi:MAG: hypothetical protein RIM99_01770 [Cyclobacteriaceae bacterium]
MNTLISKKARRLLEDNGYKFRQKENLIVFRRATDYIGAIIISIIIIIIATPFFMFNTFLGLLTLSIGFGGLYIRRKYYSKKMEFTVDLNTQKFDFFDNEIELENQSLSYASKIILHSKFVDEYSSSFKSTSEEHQITIRVELLSGSLLTLFHFHSDYSKPSEEILEVYKLIKKLIRWTKKKEAESKLQDDLIS